MANDQPQYVHYTGPSGAPPLAASSGSQQQQQQQQPLVAVGDWTRSLVELARTAELKRHALTLQLHTAQILSGHASLEQKTKAIQDIREQKNKLDSERQQLLNCLRQVNEDRDKADLLESTINRECTELRERISQATEGEYATAKRDVDKLRAELGQPPVPSLQATLDERASQFLTERRLNGGGHTSTSTSTADAHSHAQPPLKKPRGRPKGSKTKTKASGSGS